LNELDTSQIEYSLASGISHQSQIFNSINSLNSYESAQVSNLSKVMYSELSKILYPSYIIDPSQVDVASDLPEIHSSTIPNLAKLFEVSKSLNSSYPQQMFNSALSYQSKFSEI
jgi:butyrate kinase